MFYVAARPALVWCPISLSALLPREPGSPRSDALCFQVVLVPCGSTREALVYFWSDVCRHVRALSELVALGRSRYMQCEDVDEPWHLPRNGRSTPDEPHRHRAFAAVR